MHFQKHRPVSEPFSLFSGVQGVFQVDFEAVAVSCYIRTGQSQRSQPITTSHSGGYHFETASKKRRFSQSSLSFNSRLQLQPKHWVHYFQSGPFMSKGVSSVPGKHCIFKVMNGSGSTIGQVTYWQFWLFYHFSKFQVWVKKSILGYLFNLIE